MTKTPLTQEQFEQYFNEITNFCNSMLCSKNKEYAPGTDKLSNFRSAGEFTGQDEKVVLFGYMLKHWDSIKTMILSGKNYPTEQWREKIADSINYLIILYSMIKEDMKSQACYERDESSEKVSE